MFGKVGLVGSQAPSKSNLLSVEGAAFFKRHHGWLPQGQRVVPEKDGLVTLRTDLCGNSIVGLKTLAVLPGVADSYFRILYLFNTPSTFRRQWQQL